MTQHSGPPEIDPELAIIEADIHCSVTAGCDHTSCGRTFPEPQGLHEFCARHTPQPIPVIYDQFGSGVRLQRRRGAGKGLDSSSRRLAIVAVADQARDRPAEPLQAYASADAGGIEYFLSIIHIYWSPPGRTFRQADGNIF